MFEIKDLQIASKVKEKIQHNQFIHHLGFEFLTVSDGLVEGYLPMRPAYQQQNGFAHGGIISTLCDTVAGFAAYTVIPLEAQVVTAEIKIVYYHPGIGNRLYARGWVDKSGRKLQFCESEIYTLNNKEKKVIAKATATMIVIK